MKKDLLEVRFRKPTEGRDGAGLSWAFTPGPVVTLAASLAQRFLAEGSAALAEDSFGPPPPKDGGLRVRFTALAVGSTPRGHYCYQPGHVVRLAPTEAHQFVRGNFATWDPPRPDDPLMRVRFETSIAGHDEAGGSFGYGPGEVAAVPRTLAEKWIESGVCSETTEAPRAAPVTEAAVEFAARLAARR